MKRREFMQLIGIGTEAILTGCNEILLLKLIDYEQPRMAHEVDLVQPLAERITAEATTDEAAVIKLNEWMEQNFFHYYREPGWEENWSPEDCYPEFAEGGGIFNYQDISIIDVLKKRAGGCQLTSFFLITMTRSLSIPVEYSRVTKNKVDVVDEPGHGTTKFPSLNRYVHGDHLANLITVPGERLLLSEDELKQVSREDPSGTGSYFFAPHQLASLRRSGNLLYLWGSLEDSFTDEELERISRQLQAYQPLINQPNRYGRLPISGEKIVESVESLLEA